MQDGAATDSDWEEHCFVVSGSDAQAHGVFLIASELEEDSPSLEIIDTLASHGCYVGKEFARLIVSTTEPDAANELIVYDERGVVSYRRIDEVADAHGLAWDGAQFVIPNTARNQIAWLRSDGTVARVWGATDFAEDTWHINGIEAYAGKLYASAFGRFSAQDELKDKQRLPSSGLVFDVDSGREVVTGLACPHDPRRLGRDLLVCDSLRHRLLRVDPSNGACHAAVDLGRWTRGLAIAGDRIYVGLSADRYECPQAPGGLAILDRATLQIVRIVPLPCVEVNSVAVLPKRLRNALRRGFRTNAYRVREQDRDDLFRLVGNIHPDGAITPMRPLEPSECRAAVRAEIPHEVRAGRSFGVVAYITNGGPQTLMSVPPYPVNLGFAFRVAADGTETGRLDARRYVLPEPIAPSQTARVAFDIRAPEQPGTYIFSLSLVQEAIRWFKDCDPNAEFEQLLVVQSDEHRNRESGGEFAEAV